MAIDTETPAELALAFEPAGYEQIPPSTVLTRLNYYDGKFLRADALRLEQNYLRRLAELGARAGSAGLVYGFDVSIDSGEGLTIGGGLAFDAAGRVLYLPASFGVSLQQLLDSTRQATPQAFVSEGSSGFEICDPGTTATPPPAGTSGPEFFLISIAHAEEACGEEDVFGQLCDDGCATSTDRAYLIEGVVVRATPFQPQTPFVTSTAVSLNELHARSQLASAVYEDERLAVHSQISKAGLLSGGWCNGAPRPAGWEVPIAIVGRLASSTFVDEWIVRRERMDTPPRRFWAWRMAMRPWEAFLAQVLQFQCQLPSALGGRGGDATATDPCDVRIDALHQAAQVFDDLELAYTTAGNAPIGLSHFQAAHLQLKKVIANAKVPSQRILIDGGIVELPPGGYLPVTPGVEPSVQEQVRRLLGGGVDLRFCTCRADFVAHALETVQHMDRISLLQGLDDPTSKPKVDILVPDGAIGSAPPKQATGWDVRIGVSALILGSRGAAAGVALTNRAAAVSRAMLTAHGAGRSANVTGGGLEFRFAGQQEEVTGTGSLTHLVDNEAVGLDAAGGFGAATSPLIGVYGTVTCDKNPLALDVGGTFTLHGEGAAAEDLAQNPVGATGTGDVTFTVASHTTLPGGGTKIGAAGTLTVAAQVIGSSGNDKSDSVDVHIDISLHTETAPPTVLAEVRSAEDPNNADGELLLWASWQGSPLELVVAAGQSAPSASSGGAAPADTGANATLEEAAGTLESAAPALGTPAGGGLFPAPPVPRILARADLNEDAGVFTDGNAAHEDAQAGLETLATVLKDTSYTGAIEQELFNPNAGTGVGGGVLTATRDWVLFHRRRVKDCDAAPAPVVTPTATHEVRFVERAHFSEVIRYLQTGNLPAALKVSQRVGDADFAIGTANLVTPAAELLKEWQDLAGSKPIALVVAAEPPTVTASTALLKAQAAAAAVACGGDAVKSAGVFPASPIPTGDQAITFLAGTKNVAAASYAAYATANSDLLGTLTGTPDFSSVVDDPNSDLTALGTVTFTPGTTTITSNQLTSFASGENNVRQALVLERASEPTTENTDAQAHAIGVALGENGPGYQTEQGVGLERGLMAGHGAYLHLPDREHVRAHAAEARTPATVKAGAEPRAGPRADDADLAAEANGLWTRLATRASEEAPPLDGRVRERMEARFGENFGNVKIHNTPAAGESARSIHARAYALGEDLVFAPGQFAPDTSIGDNLLEHELGHVVEQRHGAPRGVYRAPDDSVTGTLGLGPIREPRQFQVDPSLGVLSLGLSTLDAFDFNGAGLTAKHAAEIVDVAEKVIMLLGKMPTGRITVTGHTDLVGGEDSNVKLGLRRAEAVRAALVKAGIPESAISAASEGSHNPVVNTKGQEPRNRRVEVRFEGDLLVPGRTPSRLTPPSGLSSDPGAFDFTLHPDPLSPRASETPFVQPPASSKPAPKASEGPAKPGSAGDVLDAITKVPEVKRLIDQAKEGGLGDLGKLSPGEKVAVGVVTVPLVTGALAGIWSDPSGRKTLLDFADGKEIPVPGVPWLKLKPITKGGAAGGMLQIDVLKIVPGLK